MNVAYIVCTLQLQSKPVFRAMIYRCFNRWPYLFFGRGEENQSNAICSYFSVDSIGEYIAQGASAVVLSDAIFDKEAMCQRNFNTIHELARLAASQGVKALER